MKDFVAHIVEADPTVEIFTDVMSLITGAGGDGDVEASLNFLDISGGTGNIIVTPQYSYDKATWFDDEAFDPVADSETFPFKATKQLGFTGQFVRFKIATDGDITSVTVDIFARSVTGGEGGTSTGGGGGGDASAANQVTEIAHLSDIKANTDQLHLAAPTSTKGFESIDATVGGTDLIPANPDRRYALIQNKNSVGIWVGTGVIDDHDIWVGPNSNYIWETQEAVRALSSSGSVVVTYIDLTN